MGREFGLVKGGRGIYRINRCVTGFALFDVDVESSDGDERDESGPPLDQEHDAHAQQGAEQAHPLVVVLEGGPPAGSARQRGVETRVVDERVRHEKEVGYDGRDRVQLAQTDEHARDQVGQQVAAPFQFIIS